MSKILIVDDVIENRYMLDALLHGNGYETALAENGAVALEILRNAPVDLILSDILMPAMDGFELCRTCKQDEKTRAIPFVVYTATYTDPSDERFALSLGADRFLIKPLEPEALLAVIREILQDPTRGERPAGCGPLGLEMEFFRQHNAALFKKLEDKMVQLEREVRERKQAENALRQSEERFRILFEHAADSILLLDIVPEGIPVIRDANSATLRLLGYERDELIGQPLSFIEPAHDVFKAVHERRANILSGARTVFEASHRCKDGTIREFECSAAETQIGSKTFAISVERDITERKRAEGALHESEEQYRHLFESMEQGVVYQAADGSIVSANPAAERILGVSLDQMKGRTSTDPRWRAVREDGSDLPGGEHPAIVALRSGRPVLGTLMGVFHPAENGHRWILVDAIPEFRPGEAAPYRVYTIFADITERRRLEEQLREAQKMDAIGRLAGGVAHDFNNALTVILGFAELALRQLNPLDPLRHHMNEIVGAVNKSSNLTRQLLAFARRQIVTLRVLDLNVATASLATMLPRLIGEDIDLRIVPSAGLWNVRIDPSQVDQILINLVTNARDAIADTGAITVETANVVLSAEHCRQHPGVAPGDCVMLAVSDTGVGMDKATMERAFEPFFTTKADGKGTGLGLATVYGIANQSGGFVDVYSEPGHGTTFKIYLPRFVGDAEQPVQKKEPGSLRGTETVLIVEDEPLLLEIIQEGLQELGYSVLAAGSPGDAILLCEKHAGEIRLLVTDVIMPTMNGKELQQRLERIKPGLRTIFMSGYTADIVTHRGIVEADILFVQKPFTIEALASKIREALQD